MVPREATVFNTFGRVAPNIASSPLEERVVALVVSEVVEYPNLTLAFLAFVLFSAASMLHPATN